MADGFVFDLEAEYPDVIIDTIRRHVLAAITDLKVHADQLDAALLLVGTTYDVASTFLTTVGGIQSSGVLLQQTVAAMRQAQIEQGQALETLAAQVAALQPSPPPALPSPTTGGVG